MPITDPSSGLLGGPEEDPLDCDVQQTQLAGLDVAVVAAGAVIEVLDARYVERDTFGQRPQDALRCVRADDAEDRQGSGQLQSRACGRTRYAHLTVPHTL